MSNNIVPFTYELAQNLYESNERFPVDFEYAVDWLGYSRKSNAKRALVKNFTKDVDYLIVEDIHMLNPEEVVKRPQGGGSQPEVILLTANCLKEMGMLAQTEKGKQVRQYFLECERIAKLAIQENAELKAALARLFDQVDTASFHRSIKEVKQVSGIRSLVHLQKKTQEYLVKGEDYVIEYGEINYNNAVFTSLALSHRSTDGVDCDALPKYILIDRDCFIRVVNKINNTLLPKKRWLPLPYIQLSFDFRLGEKK